jgi:hypothetical protein
VSRSIEIQGKEILWLLPVAIATAMPEFVIAACPPLQRRSAKEEGNANGGGSGRRRCISASGLAVLLVDRERLMVKIPRDETSTHGKLGKHSIRSSSKS